MNVILQNLSLTIASKILCHNFSAVLSPGEVWGVLGKNGAGKSSFLLALAGLKSFQNGKVLLDRQELSSLSTKSKAKIIGLLLQEQFYIFPNTVFETVIAGRHPHSSRLLGETKNDQKVVKEILLQLMLAELHSKNILELSGGEKQRVAIATLFAQDPQVMLMDEPCNHLDIHHKIVVLNKLRQLAKERNKIIIMVLHDINIAAEYCDKVMLFFEEGRIISGDTATLLTKENLSNLYHHPIKIIHSENRDYYTV